MNSLSFSTPDPETKPQILVTGGTGLVGLHLLYTLILKGYKVLATYRDSKNIDMVNKIFKNSYVNFENQFSKIEWVQLDLLNQDDVMHTFKGIKKVYHTAAEISFDYSNRSRIVKNNVSLTTNVVNACIENQVEKLCHVSSVASLGKNPNEGLVDENCQWTADKGVSAYSKSKYLSELEVWRGIAEGLNAVIVNPSVIIGPGNWDKGSGLFYSTVANGLKYYTPGGVGIVDVRDVAEAMILMMEGNYTNERFILNGHNIKYKDLFTEIANSIEEKVPTREVKKWEMQLAVVFFEFVRKITGISPRITKETARTAFNVSYYSSQKILEKSGFQFRSWDETFRYTGEAFKRK